MGVHAIQHTDPGSDPAKAWHPVPQCDVPSVALSLRRTTRYFNHRAEQWIDVLGGYADHVIR